MTKVKLDYQGYLVEKRILDGYINLSQLCNAGGKKINNWYELKSTKRYLEKLSTDINLPILSRDGTKALIMQDTYCGKTDNWVHPEIANEVSSWIRKKLPKSRTDVGYIYLIQASGYLKLGYSLNVDERLKSLSRWPGEAIIVGKIKGTQKQEIRLHSLLKKTGKVYGNEWYPIQRKDEILNRLTRNNATK